jgi:hypothetical protein
MLDGGVAVHERLGGAELEQQIGAFGRERRLGERAAKVSDRALGRAAGARAVGGVAQRRDDL